jgi:hypothetical protein
MVTLGRFLPQVLAEEREDTLPHVLGRLASLGKGLPTAPDARYTFRQPGIQVLSVTV